MNQQQNQKLYVGNLNFDANEEQVRELFSAYGGVDEVNIVMDRFSNRSRGFAFVKMDSTESAGKAKDALHDQVFQGKRLVIDWARTEQRDRPAGGERRGPGGGGDFSQRSSRPRREWGDRGGDRRDFRGGGDRGYYSR